jgi:hypothetical protein
MGLMSTSASVLQLIPGQGYAWDPVIQYGPSANLPPPYVGPPAPPTSPTGEEYKELAGLVRRMRIDQQDMWSRLSSDAHVIQTLNSAIAHVTQALNNTIIMLANEVTAKDQQIRDLQARYDGDIQQLGQDMDELVGYVKGEARFSKLDARLADLDTAQRDFHSKQAQIMADLNDLWAVTTSRINNLSDLLMNERTERRALADKVAKLILGEQNVG